MARPDRADVALKLLAIFPAGTREYMADMGGSKEEALKALEYLQTREWIEAITSMGRGYIVFRVTDQGRRRLARMGYAP